MNFIKSKVYGIGVSENEIVTCAHILGCEAVVLPIKYLSLPLGTSMALKRNWKPIVEKIRGKLSTWKAKNLSFGGSSMLIKPVLGSLRLYYFSLFRAPMLVITTLEKLGDHFFVGGGAMKNTKFIR